MGKRTRVPLLIQGVVLSGFALASQYVSSSPSCIELEGIESGGGEGLLDLDELLVSLENEPFDLSNPLVPTVAACSSSLETPIAMRALLAIDTGVFSVASMFHPEQTALDIFGDEDTSNSRRRCQPAEGEDTTLFDLHLRVAIVYALVYGGYLGMPFCLDDVDPLMTERGHPLSYVLEGEPSTNTPWGLAKAYVDEVHAYLLANDGWNADGSLSREYNRIPFSDFSIKDSAGNSWSEYTPANSPYKFSRKRRWQPLMESDGLGFLSTQEHVTPHIGVTGRFFGFNSTEDEEEFASRELDNPGYCYRKESRRVIKESRRMARDEFKQAAITLFDDKFNSLIPIKIAYFLRETTEQTTQDFYRLTTEVQLAIYNGVLLAWREKIRHDLPRPTSVIRSKFGDDKIRAYGGPGESVVTMKASEWEPFIRTMPHSEFPSGSACICQVFAEQVALYLGTDVIDPPLEFASFEFSSWSEISEICGDSRMWGGMHFGDAVPAGAGLCGGGDMAVSVTASLGRLIAGDTSAAVFKMDVGELMVRPL